MNKSDHIREILKIHGLNVNSKQVVETLATQGISVSYPLVKVVRDRVIVQGFILRGRGRSTKKYTENTVKDLHLARDFIRTVGGVTNARRLLDDYEKMIS